MSLLNRSLFLADVAPPEGYTSNFEYCIKLVNTEKYPNYLFFASIKSVNQRQVSNYIIIDKNRCVSISGYRPSATISAMPKKLVQTKDLKLINGDLVLQNPKPVQKLISATPTIDRPGSMPSSFENKIISTEVKIESFDTKALVLSTSENSPKIPNWIIFPLIGIAILGWTVARRKQKMVSK